MGSVRARRLGAVAVVLAAMAAVVAVVLALAPGTQRTSVRVGERAAPWSCRVGESVLARRIAEEERAGIRPATPHIVIGCARLRPSGRRVELIGYQQTGYGGRAARLCIDARDPATGQAHGCGTNRVYRGEVVDATSVVGCPRVIVPGVTATVSGATSADVARIAVSFRRQGRRAMRAATLVRVRAAELLRRLQVRRPFGRYLVEVPADARGLRVHAFNSAGGAVGRARLPFRDSVC
jgi:hypothetical protein